MTDTAPFSNQMKARMIAAFTLLELMVSMTVLAVLLLIMLSMVEGATRLWRDSENRVDSFREARAALNVIASDLSSAYISSNTNFFKFSDQELHFLTAIPRKYQEPGDDTSDLCEIGYTWSFERPDTTRSSKTVPESYNLYRTFKSSSPTFSEIRNKTLFKDSSGSRELLARNITEFEVETFTLDEVGNPTPFKESAQTPMPDVIQIRLTAINNATAQKFSSGPSDWSNKSSNLYKQNARTFVTRVQLNTSAIKATPSPTPGTSNP